MANEKLPDLERELELAEQTNQQLDKRKEVEDKLNDLAAKRNQMQEQFKNQVKGSLSEFTGIKTESDTVLGNMTRMVAEGGGLINALKGAAKAFTELMSLSNILGSLVDTIVKSTIQFLKTQDDIAKSFETSVGNAAKFKGEITSLYLSTAGYATSMKEAAESFIALKNGFAGFEDLSKRERMSLADTTIKLNKLGVETQTLVSIQATLHKQMGMSIKQTTEMEKQLYATSIAMGIPPKKMMQDFATIAPRLGVYGSQMKTVFLDLQDAAKKTGIGMGELLNIADKFNTFDQAAENVGTLNAILGGDFLDAQKMITLNEAERVKYLQEQLKASGKNLNNMDRFQQQAIAQSLGLKDTTELMKLYNNETGKTGNKLTDQEKAQQTMNRAVESAVTLSDRLNRMWEEFGTIFGPIFQPVMGWLKEGAATITGWIGSFRRWMNEVANKETANKIMGYWNEFKEFMGSIWNDYIKPVIKNVLEFFGVDTESLSKVMKGGFDQIPQFIENTKNKVKAKWEELKKEFPFLQTMMDWFGSIKAKFDGLSTGGKLAVGAAAVGGIGLAVNTLSGSSKEATTSVEGTTNAIGKDGQGGITGAINGFGETISKFGDAFKNFGIAVGGIGIGVAAAAAAFASLVNAFGQIDDVKIFVIVAAIKELLAVFGIGAAGAVGLAGLTAWLDRDGKNMGEKMKDFGIMAAIIGVGFGVAVFGIVKLVESLGKMNISKDMETIGSIFRAIGDGLQTLTSRIGAMDAIKLGSLLEDLGDAFEQLGKAAPGVNEMFKTFTSISSEQLEKMFKSFGESVTKIVAPAINGMVNELKTSKTPLEEFQKVFHNFQETLQKISEQKMDKIVQLREEIHKMSDDVLKFSTIVNGFTNLGIALRSISGVSEGISSLNTSLDKLTAEKMEKLDKIVGLKPEEIEKLKEVNTVKIEADKDSPLNIIAESLKKGNFVRLYIDGKEVATSIADNPDAARALRGVR